MGRGGVAIHRLGGEVCAVSGTHDTRGEDRGEAPPYGRLGLRVRDVVTDAQQERAEPDETGDAPRGQGDPMHSSTAQGAWTAIHSKGRDRFQWWALHAHDIDTPVPDDLPRAASRLTAGFPDHVQSWPIRDRNPLKQ